MWRFWIGFNISQAMAAILFGLIYGFLAIVHGGLMWSGPHGASVARGSQATAFGFFTSLRLPLPLRCRRLNNKVERS
jgi:hypothetical protein